MKKTKKRISLFLALVLALGMLPASVLSSAAAEAYQVLFQPSSQIQDGLISGAYGDIGLVLNVNTFAYRIVRFTGSGIENIPGEYDSVSAVGGGYIIVGSSSGGRYTYSAIDTKGTKVLDLGDIYVDEIDANGIAKGISDKYVNDTYIVRYYQIDLNARKIDEITEDQYDPSRGIVSKYNNETKKYDLVNASGQVLFGGYDYAGDFYNGYACVSIGDIHQVIDTAGNVVLSDAGKDYLISYYEFNVKKDGLVPVHNKEMTWLEGYADLSGNIVIPAQHIMIKDPRNGYVSAQYLIDENTGTLGGILYDVKGNIVVPAGEGNWISSVSPDGLVWVCTQDWDNNTGSFKILKVGGGSAPVTPAGVQAMPTNDTLRVNGEIKNATVYKIDGSNYFKIRDLAAVLNSTSKQFAVGYDGATNSVTATTGQPYQLAGGELAGAAPSAQTATVSNDTIIVNGSVAENVTVYKIDGSNYFKLRDLGAALGFDVGWSQEEGMFINTGD